jgi:endonuclease/exonuclease/phosphatase family metal-dependent hydrolase
MPISDTARAIDHILLWGEANILAHVTVTEQDALDASDHCPLYVDVKLA